MDTIIANPKTEAESKKIIDFLMSMNIDVEVYEIATKEYILAGIEQGFKEVKLHGQGKIKLRNAFDLYDEL
mgnify:CR=1 FL=1